MASENNNTGRAPVYFVSHGGPTIMFETDHPAFKALQKIGREITATVQPKAIVVFSAHWQSEPNSVEVNVNGMNELIYDYYGFPDHYYKVKYPNIGSPELGNRIIGLLEDAGIAAKPTKRGLDHGVFASFTCMFDPEDNPLSIPVVQVSLFASDSPEHHIALGAAIASLRDENIVIIGSGMAVHNTRDFIYSQRKGDPLPYVQPFDQKVKEAVLESDGRERRLKELLWDANARKAHPTFEHLLPLHIAAGAAGDDEAERVFEYCVGSLSWAQFRFGKVGRSIRA